MLCTVLNMGWFFGWTIAIAMTYRIRVKEQRRDGFRAAADLETSFVVVMTVSQSHSDAYGEYRE